MKFTRLIAILALITFGASSNAAVDTFTMAPPGGVFPPGWTSPETGLLYEPILPPAGGHLHFIPVGPTGSQLEYEADTGGIYVSSDTPFDLQSWDLNRHDVKFAQPGTDIPANLIVEGFDTLLTTTNDPNLTPIATQTFEFGGPLGTLQFDPSFTGLRSFRFYFENALGSLPPSSSPDPSVITFMTMYFDNVTVEPTSTVIPIPAAAYLFGSALIGLVSVGRRKLMTRA